MVASDVVVIVEPDDGTGWAKAEKEGSGESGLVPANYIELLSPNGQAQGSVSVPSRCPQESASSAPPPVRLGEQQKKDDYPCFLRLNEYKRAVRALYDYDSARVDELSLVEGETVELTERGMDYADGWAEVKRGSRIGIAPSNYLEPVVGDGGGGAS
jgi:hypothetical protein